MTQSDKIDKIYTMVIENNTLTKQTHAAVFGNGKPGLKTDMERIKGACMVLFPVLSLIITGIGIYVATR
jgi:hypothetical protein